MRISILSFLLLLSRLIFAQSEKINQPDSAGKRNGKWTRYLDHNWKTVNDSSKAVYFRYTFYDHGVNTQPMGACGKKGWKLEGSEGKNAGLKMLDGEYKWYDEKSRLVFIHVFNKGEYVSYREYYRSGELHTSFDYKKHFTGQPYSWYITEYDKAGKIKYEGYVKKMRKDTGP